MGNAAAFSLHCRDLTHVNPRKRPFLIHCYEATENHSFLLGAEEWPTRKAVKALAAASSSAEPARALHSAVTVLVNWRFSRLRPEQHR